MVSSAGSFNDPVKGKSLAQAMINRGADVIFPVAGNTGIGANEAVKGSGDAYLIGDDLDKDADMPGKVLTSTLKRMDIAVYGAIREAAEGRFKGGHHWLGAADGAMDITEMKYSKQLFSPAQPRANAKSRDPLKAGKLTVPAAPVRSKCLNRPYFSRERMR